MAQREKLLKRFLEKPKDLTWDEFVAVLGYFGFRCESGKGSRRAFIHKDSGAVLFFHEPHPRNTVLVCYVRQAIGYLKESGLLK